MGSVTVIVSLQLQALPVLAMQITGDKPVIFKLLPPALQRELVSTHTQ
jgi:hypothetical protein